MKVRIDFCDFHPGFRKTSNFFYDLLRKRFDVELCDQPDFLIYGPYSQQHRLHTGVKIFFNPESGLPDFNECDYAFTSNYLDDPRHYRLPLYVTYGSPESIVKARDNPEALLRSKTRFCAFVVGNHHPRKNKNRVDFFHRLSKYKRVDSAGRYLNNIGVPLPGWSEGKVEFLRSCKFNIAFENASIPGYTTEKIFEAMQARCLPIYWGDPLITHDFNTKSFLYYFDFPREEALIEKIIELDRDDAKYLDYMRQPYFHNDKPNVNFSEERLLAQFGKIFSTSIRPVAQRRGGFPFGRWRIVKRNRNVEF